MAYIGREPQIGNFQICDAISVVNGQAAYTMQVSSTNVSPETANHVLCSLNGVLQKPGSSFTISGSTITFASNLVTNDVIDFIHILGSVLDLGVPSDSTVSTAKIVDDAVTLAKMASGTDGNIISYDASGNPVAVATGSSGQVLTSAGAGAVPTFADGGETNTPMFFVSGGNQTISHNSNTKMTISSEAIDTDNCFDLGSNNRFTPNKAGKYFFTLNLFSPSGDDIDYWSVNVKKNGGSGGGFSGVQRDYNNACYNGILTANGSSDYFEAFCEQESGSNRTIAVSEFSAFYIAT